jgi:hypothetical protein
VPQQTGRTLILSPLRQIRRGLAEAKLNGGEVGGHITYVWASSCWRPVQRWHNEIRELCKTVSVIRHLPVQKDLAETIQNGFIYLNKTNMGVLMYRICRNPCYGSQV